MIKCVYSKRNVIIITNIGKEVRITGAPSRLYYIHALKQENSLPQNITSIKKCKNNRYYLQHSNDISF
jgi:hypothetical protein